MTTVEHWDPTGTYRFPNIDREIEGLKYSTIMYGGFATLDYDLYRQPWRYYADVALNNIVRVRSRHRVVWEGRIHAPINSTTDMKIAVEADGYIERLKTRMPNTTVDIGVNGRLSAWLISYLLGDTNLGFLGGVITGSDYQFPLGLELVPYTFFAGAIEKGNAANGNRYGFFPPPCSNQLGRYFDYTPMSATPDYYLDMRDCNTEIQYTLEGVENCLMVTYADSGNVYHYSWWPNSLGAINPAGTPVPEATSAALYGRRDGELVVPGVANAATAQQFASIALAWRKSLKPASDIVATKITDAAGNVVPNAEVTAGGLLHTRGLNPGMFPLLQAQSINELSTWPVVFAESDIDNDLVTLSPGGLSNRLDKLLSRAEMKAK